MSRTLSLLWTLAIVSVLAGEAVPDAKSQKAVLVTGASSGIGRKITEKLAADGYFVYAGARKEEDLKALGAIRNVQAIRLDVTKLEDIDAAVETVKHAGRGLYGLVNNAGVATWGTFAEMKPEEFDLVMAVNVAGPYRISKAFQPLIVAEKGRITNIGSVSGILARPRVGAYAMSKHAIEAYTDSLAQQLAGFGVTVNVIEPGNYASDVVKNAIKRGGGPQATSAASSVNEDGDPAEVATAVEKALFEPNPKRRYLVVPNQYQAEVTIRKQIEQLVQLNEGQPYTYDRDTLINMLSDALAQSRPRYLDDVNGAAAQRRP